MNRPVHFEILGENPAALAEFYGKVFGWKAATGQGPQTYWLVTTGPDGEPGINGGIMHRHLSQPVINTISVESLDEALAKVAEAGGKKVHGPNEIPGVGMHAYCADPEGNLFGVLEPKH
jgi:predicted enzyme related to lactoylglutathione lyase